MTVSFQTIPSAINRPGAYGEVVANPLAVSTVKVLMIGIHQGASNVTNTVVSNATQIATLCGYGSLTHRMGMKFFDNCTTPLNITMYSVGVNTALATFQTITFNGTATNAGTVSLSIGNDNLTVAYNAGDTANTISTAVRTAVNAVANLPVTCAAITGTGPYTLPFQCKTAIGESFIFNVVVNNLTDLNANGLTVTVPARTLTTNTVDITPALTANQTQLYDLIILPTTSVANMAVVDSWFETRYAYNDMSYGGAIAAIGVDTAGASNAYNHKHVTIYQQKQAGQQSPYLETLGAIGGQIANLLLNDISNIVQNIFVKGITATNTTPWTKYEEELIYASRRNPVVFDEFGQVSVNRAITLYATDSAGNPDASWHDLETSVMVGYFMRGVASRITSKFPKAKLVSDTSNLTVVGNNSIVSPKDIKAEVVTYYDELVHQGKLQDTVSFAKNAVFEINGSDPNRVDAYLPITLVGGFRIFAFQTKFSFKVGG